MNRSTELEVTPERVQVLDGLGFTPGFSRLNGLVHIFSEGPLCENGRDMISIAYPSPGNFFCPHCWEKSMNIRGHAGEIALSDDGASVEVKWETESDRLILIITKGPDQRSLSFSEREAMVLTYQLTRRIVEFLDNIYGGNHEK